MDIVSWYSFKTRMTLLFNLAFVSLFLPAMVTAFIYTSQDFYKKRN